MIVVYLSCEEQGCGVGGIMVEANEFSIVRENFRMERAFKNR